MAIYEYNARIRYSEIDSSGYLSAVALIDLFQNCSTFQSEDLGYGIDYLAENNRAWVLSSWQLCINKLPRLGDNVVVRTWSYGIRLAIGYRNFALISDNGDTLAYANSVWAYIDTKNGKPVKAPEDMIEAYGKQDPIDMECAPRKIKLPENMKEYEAFEVKSYFIDTNGHMNNEKYVLAALEYLPADYKIKEIRADYRRPAMPREKVLPKVGTDDNSIVVAMYGCNDTLYASVQFMA